MSNRSSRQGSSVATGAAGSSGTTHNGGPEHGREGGSQKDRDRHRRSGGSVRREETKQIGDYEIVKTLGHGSFGKVKRASPSSSSSSRCDEWC